VQGVLYSSEPEHSRRQSARPPLAEDGQLSDAATYTPHKRNVIDECGK